jgi:hypothetical protein
VSAVILGSEVWRTCVEEEFGGMSTSSKSMGLCSKDLEFVGF